MLQPASVLRASCSALSVPSCGHRCCRWRIFGSTSAARARRPRASPWRSAVSWEACCQVRGWALPHLLVGRRAPPPTACGYADVVTPVLRWGGSKWDPCALVSYSVFANSRGLGVCCARERWACSRSAPSLQPHSHEHPPHPCMCLAQQSLCCTRWRAMPPFPFPHPHHHSSASPPLLSPFHTTTTRPLNPLNPLSCRFASLQSLCCTPWRATGPRPLRRPWWETATPPRSSGPIACGGSAWCPRWAWGWWAWV